MAKSTVAAIVIAYAAIAAALPFTAAALTASPSSAKISDIITIQCTNGANDAYDIAVYFENDQSTPAGGDNCSVLHGNQLLFSGVPQPFNGRTWFIYEIDTSTQDSCGTGVSRNECNSRAISSVSVSNIVTGGGGGPIQFPPDLELFSPLAGVFSERIAVDYKASDDNDLGPPDVRERFGLGPAPVSIFYTDLLDAWDGRIVSPDIKKLAAKDLPAAGVYQLDVKDLPPTDNYRIIVNAKDNFGTEVERVTGFIAIDHAAPVFTVTADPPSSRGEDVKLIIEASEELAQAPEVLVTQRGYQSLAVIMRGEGKHYEGVYRVVTGYDGPAAVAVKSRDIAGNTGETIVSGSRFSVGVEPPPRPVITAPTGKEPVSGAEIAVSGTAREDAEVLLTVNGKDEYRVRPERDGSFVFKSVKLDSKFNRGLNVLSVVARDEAGNASDPARVEVRFNLEPTIKIITPQTGTVATGTIAILLDARDANNDRLNFTFEISRDGGENWILIAENFPRRQYPWDTTAFPDGEYILRVTADDGTLKAQAVSGTFAVKNLLPAFSFTDGERTVINKNSYVISGTVTSPETPEGRQSLISLEYSRDGGRLWQTFTPADGAADSFEEKFSFPLSGLEERVYHVIFRAQNRKQEYGRSTKTVVVDFGPPPAPAIEEPVSGQIFSDGLDANPGLPGLQFAVSGKAEAGGSVAIDVGGRVFKAKVGRDGSFKSAAATLVKHGSNEVKIFAVDSAGNNSKPATLSINYNNPPVLKFFSPRPNRGLAGKAAVRFDVNDPDGDPVQTLTLSYRKGKAPFRVLARDVRVRKFDFDVSELPAGKDYQMKLEASDGVSPVATIADFAVDHTPPAVSVEPLKQTVYRAAFVLSASGAASDDLAVEFVEYSIDGEHWFKSTITGGFLAPKAAFKIRHPQKLEDGAYEIRFRAIDLAGNISPEKTLKVIVDTKPPRIGSFMISRGSLSLFPAGGVFRVPADSGLDFKISLESDTKSATLLVGSSSAELVKNRGTGLWQGVLEAEEAGRQILSISAEDTLGNKAERELGVVEAGEPGQVSSGPDTIITVLVFSPDTGTFVRWAGESYGAKNPLASDANGEYTLLLPPGRYQLLLQKPGFSRLRSSDFELREAGFINFDFALQERRGARGLFENIIEKITVF